MAKRKSARVSQEDGKGKLHATTKPEEPVYGVYVPESLHEAIENERGTLSKAESILRCMAISLEYDDMPSGDGPHYPDVAEIACRLVRQALNGLDSLTLRNCVMRDRGMLKGAQKSTPERPSTTSASPNTARRLNATIIRGDEHGSR
jgi:hypothetical protein